MRPTSPPSGRSIHARCVSPFRSSDESRGLDKLTGVDIAQAHEIVYDSLRKRDLGFQVEKEFDSPGLFLGSVLTLDVCAVYCL